MGPHADGMPVLLLDQAQAFCRAIHQRGRDRARPHPPEVPDDRHVHRRRPRQEGPRHVAAAVTGGGQHPRVWTRVIGPPGARRLRGGGPCSPRRQLHAYRRTGGRPGWRAEPAPAPGLPSKYSAVYEGGGLQGGVRTAGPFSAARVGQLGQRACCAVWQSQCHRSCHSLHCESLVVSARRAEVSPFTSPVRPPRRDAGAPRSRQRPAGLGAARSVGGGRCVEHQAVQRETRAVGRAACTA